MAEVTGKGSASSTGRYTAPDGKIFEGDFEIDGDERYGKGKITYPNGDVYEGGVWVSKANTVKGGTGKLTRVNSDVYEGYFCGDFIDRNIDGTGKYTFADGRVFIPNVDFAWGQGKGKMIYPDGRIEENKEIVFPKLGA